MPAPLAPIAPTMPAGGSSNDRSSISSRSQKPLASLLGLDHRLAQPLPGRDVNLRLVELQRRAPRRSGARRWQTVPSTSCAALCSSCAPTPARGDRALARGLLAPPLPAASSSDGATSSRCPPTEAVAAVELEVQPATLSRESRSSVTAATVPGTPGVRLQPRDQPASRWWSARRAAAGRGSSAGAGRAPRGGTRRPRASDVGVPRRKAQHVHREVDVRSRPTRPRRRSRVCIRANSSASRRIVHGQLVESVEQRERVGDAVADVAEHVLGLVEFGSCSSRPTLTPRGLGLAAELVSRPAMIRSSVDCPTR